MAAGLADVLVEVGKLSPDQLNQATEHAAGNGGNVTRSLLQLGMATENDLVEALATRLGMGFASMEHGEVDMTAASLLSRSVATDLQALPVGFDETGSGLLVAISDPSHTHVAERVMQVTGMPVTLVLAPKKALQQAISHLTVDEAPTGDAAGMGAAYPEPAAPATSAEGASEASPRLEVVEDRSLPRLDSETGSAIDLDELLIKLVDRGGSDLHLTAGIAPSIRVNGEIEAMDEFPLCLPDELQKMLYSIMTQKQREQFENELELDMSYSIPGRARFRVNVFRQRDAIGSACRSRSCRSKTSASRRRWPTSPTCRAGSCSSPVRRDPGSRPPWPRSSTW